MVCLAVLCLLLVLLGAYRRRRCRQSVYAALSDSENSGRHRVVWQCNLAPADEGAWWVDYAETENKMIESAWLVCNDGAALLDAWGEPRWRVSFGRMVQLTQPDDCSDDEVVSCRPIRRTVVTHE